VVDDCINNVFAFTRRDLSGESITAICNFSGIEQKDYRIGIDEGTYQVLFCTDAPKFGGTGAFKKRILHTTKIPSQGKEQSIKLNIPKLTCIYITIKK
jgi:1,4-alpha-glucan branching enzyme